MIRPMTRNVVMIAALIGLIVTPSPAAPPTTQAAPSTQPAARLTARAHRMLANLKQTAYQHVTDIDEATGEYYCDCSGLVSWVVRKELPAHYKVILYPPKYKHPRAIEFCQHFEATPVEPREGAYWRRVLRLADAEPGDIIAWRKDPLPAKGNTGHVVLVDAAPRRVGGGDVWEVVVIDSTGAPHKDDTRKPGEGGVGRGTIFLKVDGDGRPTAYASRSPDGPIRPYAMAIGRAVQQ
jgi:hypothetical protein